MSIGTTRVIPAHWYRWFMLGLGVLLLALSVQYAHKVAGYDRRDPRSAFERWRNQILHVGDENIYERYTYPNPPIMALLLEPLAEMPPLVGSLCWYYLKVALTLIAFLWVFRLVENPDHPYPAAAKVVTVLLSLRPVIGDLSHGNVNLFILFLVIGSLYALHKGRDALSGLTLALAIACKVTPALFVPYLVWKRAWKALAGCGLGLVIFWIIVPGLFLGMERNLDLLSSWFQQMVVPYLFGGVVTSDYPNQSLPGLVIRLLTHNPSFVDAMGHPLRYDNFMALSSRAAGLIIKGCMACFAALIVWTCRTPLRSRFFWQLAAEFALVVLGMLLFSERTWKHHCVTLVLPFAVICYYLAVFSCSRSMRVYLIGTLAGVILLMMSTSTTGLAESLDSFGRQMQVYGVYVWANLLLVASLVVLLREAKHGHKLCERG
jgi:alpha-1,2-mannosyltransferase